MLLNVTVNIALLCWELNFKRRREQSLSVFFF